MKKLFTSLVVASTAATLAACGKKATTTDTKTTTTEKAKPVVTKGSIAKGSFKVGYAGSNTIFTKKLKDAITTYTQDATIKSKTGDEYFKLPSGLSLLSSDNFNSYIRESAEYKDQVKKLKTWLLDNIRFGLDNTADGYYPNGSSAGNSYHKFAPNNYGSLVPSAEDKTNTAILIMLDHGNSDFSSAKTEFDKIFAKIEKLYEALQSTTADRHRLYNALITAGIDNHHQYFTSFTSDINPDHINKGQAGHLYINLTYNFSILGLDKTFATLQTEFQTKTKTALDDKTKLAAKNLDALFVQVTNGVENSAEVYKAVVEKKEFEATKLFFVGQKTKSQSGASSKVFAGEHVSTASFNKYAAAYVAGFQAAVGTIKYSSSEDVYEETTTSFLIGSTSDSEAKKKAFAFRRGVEAAAAHSAYSKYLKVKFVSKTEDSSKSSKKLYREVSEWKSKESSKSKLYEFSSSDTFSDADRRVIYLAGTTARDWTGLLATQATQSDLTDTFKTGDDTGLIGALYNYDPLTDTEKPANSLTSKTFSRGVWVVLDKAFNLAVTPDTNWADSQQTDGAPGTTATTENHATILAADNALLSNPHNLSQVRCFAAKANKGITTFERHQVKFYGAIGDEVAGTEQFAKVALKGLYMGGQNYMLGKHTIFGAPLNLDSVTKSTGNARNTDTGANGPAVTTLLQKEYTPFTYGTTAQSVWAAVKGKKDSTSKAKDRFDTSLTHAWEKEVTEAELVKASPWLK